MAIIVEASGNVTPSTIAVALGRTAPEPDSPAFKQWEMWISDAEMLIQSRIDSITPTPSVDQARVDYVVREAVVAQVRRPDDATQVSVAVDDGSVSRTYRSSKGRIDILDEWWALLGLNSSGGSFAIDTVGATTRHADVCALNLGGSYCSCGAEIAGYPLYETAP